MPSGTEGEIQLKFLADGERFADIDEQTFGAKISDPPADRAVGCVTLDGGVIREPYCSATFSRRIISCRGHSLTSLPQFRGLTIPIHPLQFTNVFGKPRPPNGQGSLGVVQEAEKQPGKVMAMRC